MTTITTNDLNRLSLLFQVFMSRAEYSHHTITSDAESITEINRLVPNAMYVIGIGLVAMRQISNPSTIVVLGSVAGYSPDNKFENVYDENVIVEPKEIVQPYIHQPQSLMSNQVMSRKAIRSSCISKRM
ncbi:hypothetical protein JTE90_017579 [Oedothorax gibbosus]|uniref:Uncharacterized protein n=1 Tax=Oedothorax gibbosus TaxID=931172 RepID=A0AAV6TLF3_9ARAC|nr:hypothetical protein JTE90_017579 [Oedothorax gibbosus]